MRYGTKDVSSLLEDVTEMEPVSAHATSTWYGPSSPYTYFTSICHKADGRWYWAEDTTTSPPLSWVRGEDIGTNSPYSCP